MDKKRVNIYLSQEALHQVATLGYFLGLDGDHGPGNVSRSATIEHLINEAYQDRMSHIESHGQPIEKPI